MSTFSVNMVPRNADPKLEYKMFKPVTVVTNPAEEQISFLVEALREEVLGVVDGKRVKKVRKLKKLLKVSVSVLGLMVNLAPKTMAEAATAATTLTPISPALVMKVGLTIALVSVAAGIALSMIMLAIAGVYRMLRKRQEANEWTTDIIRGLVQVLISIPTVYVLYYLAQLVFKHLSAMHVLF